MGCGTCEKHKREKELLEQQKNSVNIPMQAKIYTSKRKLRKIKRMSRVK